MDLPTSNFSNKYFSSNDVTQTINTFAFYKIIY